MEIREIVDVDRPPDAVFAYVAEFEHLTEWDPSALTVTSRTPGPLAVGTAYEVASEFRGRQVDLRYQVVSYVPPRRIVLSGESDSVDATDEIEVQPFGEGARVTYVARFRFNNWLLRLVGPLLLGRAFRTLGRDAAAGMRDALQRLPAE